jgi:hypothetical protein
VFEFSNKNFVSSLPYESQTTAVNIFADALAIRLTSNFVSGPIFSLYYEAQSTCPEGFEENSKSCSQGK